MPPQFARLVYGAVQSPLLVAAAAFLFFLYLQRHPRLLTPVLAWWKRRGAQLAVVAAVLALLAYGALLAWYLYLPNFAGEVEPIVASISWFTQQGASLYHGLEDAQRYSILYGPLIFLAHGAVMSLLGPSIFSAKLVGVLAGGISLYFLFLAFARIVDRRHAIGLTALALLLYFVHGPFSFVARPDPLLLLAAAFLVLVSVGRSRPLALVALAVCVAWTTDMKLHGSAYLIVPTVWIARRFGFASTMVATLAGLALALLPFLLLGNVSLENYALWLGEATRHGLDAATFLKTLRFGLFLLLPALVLLTPVDGFRRDSRLLLVALLASFLAILFFASKPGAGLNHLLPLVPSVLFVAAEALAARARSSRGELGSIRASALAATFVTAIFIGGVVEAKCVQRLHAGARNGRAVIADIEEILRDHADLTIGMAYGGEGSAYDLTFYRPRLIFDGQPLLLDVIAVMENQRASRPMPEATLTALAEGQIRLWLVPRGGEPFTKKNWYPPHQQVFAGEFMDVLREHYERHGESEFFELWFYRDDLATTPEEVSQRRGR